jgi:hypothetical protein
MENQPLGIALAKLKARLNYPPTLSVNSAEDCRLAALLSQEQQWAADQWDWPTLDEWWDIALAPNQRYYAIPTNADYGQQGLPWNKRRTLWVNRKYSSTWEELEYGISEQEFNFIDSDIGQTNDPVLRWDYNGTAQIELWPIPASAYTVRFRGQRTLVNLATGQPYDPTQQLGNLFNPDALLDLDDTMLVGMVAAFHFGENENPLSEVERRKFVETMYNVRAQMPSREEKIVMGGNDQDGERVRLAGVKIIAVA